MKIAKISVLGRLWTIINVCSGTVSDVIVLYIWCIKNLLKYDNREKLEMKHIDHNDCYVILIQDAYSNNSE